MFDQRVHIARLWLLAISCWLLAGCSTIDDDLSDCGSSYQLDYELKLVTNMTTELTTQLSMVTDISLSAALKTHLSSVFTDYAHDVDLSFYDIEGDSLRLQHDEHIMDANQASYTLNLPKRQYMHLAAANIVDNQTVGIVNDDLCHKAKLVQAATDTINSHSTGVFTARQPMTVLEGIDQTFNVHLYMANCAATLVIDPNGHNDFTDIKVFTTGFASGYNICDSTYQFAPKSPIVRTERTNGDENGEYCFTSVNFPSRVPISIKSTRSVIDTDEGFDEGDSEDELWQFRVYVTNPDGKITETILSIHEPLRNGQLKIVKAKLADDGSAQTDDPTVGISIAIDWNDGNHYDTEL